MSQFIRKGNPRKIVKSPVDLAKSRRCWWLYIKSWRKMRWRTSHTPPTRHLPSFSFVRQAPPPINYSYLLWYSVLCVQDATTASLLLLCAQAGRAAFPAIAADVSQGPLSSGPSKLWTVPGDLMEYLNELYPFRYYAGKWLCQHDNKYLWQSRFVDLTDHIPLLSQQSVWLSFLFFCHQDISFFSVTRQKPL